MRGLAYQVFYGLPLPVRRRVARLVSPKFLVGAVAIIRDSQAEAPGRLLLLRQPPGRGWGLPAGLLKHRELPAVGAARELFEEAGVRLEPADLTPGNPNAIVHPNGGVVDTVWFASVPAESTPLAVDGGEVLEARWFPVDDLPELTCPTARLLGIYGIGPRSGLLPPSVPADPYRTPSTLPSAAPATEELAAEEPVAGRPAAGQPAAGRPVGGPPAAGPPVAGPPVAGPPVPGQPLTGPPVAGQPLTRPPVAGQPVTGPPVAGQPLTGRPVAGQPLSGPPVAGPSAAGESAGSGEQVR